MGFNYGFQGYRALHFAAETGNADLINVLIRYDADVNAQDHKGRTPLRMLPNNQDNRDQLVRIFIQAGANPFIKNTAGEIAYELENTAYIL
ncbi:hypothetical protein BIY23_01140 [Wolbachia pipientis]|uniref:Uncharacterized protein n=1 Tax=Wolbachia pipientis TaxID=955 RepID=A0A1E7QKS0_WOLPI|nr:ankyrin repeat domain-containing protein [Wolbachia pipientis]OEY87075.1 hypothetical protein BIY23_01140 [Wolbachia pipientis]